jgi:hypothetical protein
MIKNIAIFTISLLVLLITANAQLLSKKEICLKESKPNLIELYKANEPVSKSSIAKNNSPFLAGALSFIVPGAALGQFYNKQYLNFGIRVGISTLSIVWMLASYKDCNECTYFGSSPAPLAIFILNWVTSIFDAAIYNSKHLSGK